MRAITKILMATAILTIAGAAHATTVDLPAACGKDTVEFKVRTEKDHTISAPETGKALIVFVESVGEDAHTPTARFGIDGSWVGATHGNSSYTTVSVEPGVHHLCAVRQSGARADKADPGTATVNLEADKVYYYEFTVTNKPVGSAGRADGGSSGGVGVGSTPNMTARDAASVDEASFGQLNQSEGQSRLRHATFNTSTTK